MPTKQTKPFLVIEDEENDVFFLKRTIRKAGVENPIEVASNGDMAIEYLQGTGRYADRSKFPLPSLIFLDLHLPGRFGLEVLTWIRKQPEFDTIIIILLTGSKEEESIAAAYEIGANSYLVKPPSVDSLMVLINALDQYELEIERGSNE